MEKSIKEYLLDNMDEARQIVSELNSWDGSFENLTVHSNDEDFFDTYFDGRPAEAVRACYFGDYNYSDDYVRFNGYGNLESLNEYDLEEEIKSELDEIIEMMLEKRSFIFIPEEIEEIIEEHEADEEEDDE